MGRQCYQTNVTLEEFARGAHFAPMIFYFYTHTHSIFECVCVCIQCEYHSFKGTIFILWSHLKLQASLLSAYCQRSSISLVAIQLLREPTPGTPAAHHCIEQHILGTRSAPRIWFIWGSTNTLNFNNTSELGGGPVLLKFKDFSRLINNAFETAQWLSSQMMKRFSGNVRVGFFQLAEKLIFGPLFYAILKSWSTWS